MEAIVFITIQMFFEPRAVLEVGEIHEYFPVSAGNIPSRDAFRPIARKRKYGL